MIERIQQQQHIIHQTRIIARYDRLTTRFTLYTNNQVIYSSLLLFFTLRHVNIIINQEPYQLRLIYCVLWKASLHKEKVAVISELLPVRRARALIRTLFAGVINALRFIAG